MTLDYVPWAVLDGHQLSYANGPPAWLRSAAGHEGSAPRDLQVAVACRSFALSLQHLTGEVLHFRVDAAKTLLFTDL
jgi:hypothetical protein